MDLTATVEVDEDELAEPELDDELPAPTEQPIASVPEFTFGEWTTSTDTDWQFRIVERYGGYIGRETRYGPAHEEV